MNNRIDVYEELVKLAEETNEKSDQPPKLKDSAKMKKYKKDSYPRMGSDTIEVIEKLYQTKRDDSVIKYENNIMEAAHPKMCVISPAYDRINGLVENNVERQTIIMNLLDMKAPGGLVNRRYASENLLMELIRVANDMDNRDNKELCALADICIEDLNNEIKKKFTKIAILPWIIGGAIVLAASWLWGHADDPSRGLSNDIDNALTQLDDLKTNSWYESNVDGTVEQQVNLIETYLNKLKEGVNNFTSVMNKLEDVGNVNVDSSDGLDSLKNTVDISGPEVKEKLDAFVKVIEQTIPVLMKAINNFTNSTYQAEHTTPSAIGNMMGWVGEAIHGRWGLVANDFISAANALSALTNSLKDAYGKAQNIGAVKQHFEKEVADKLAKFKGANPDAAPGEDMHAVKKTVPSPGNEPKNKDDDSDYSDIMHMMGIDSDKADQFDEFVNFSKNN